MEDSTNSKQLNTNRRWFFRTSAGVVGAAAGSVVFKELETGRNGLKTEYGTFKSLYEVHQKGIGVEKIPSDLDGFLMELKFSNEVDDSLDNLLRAQSYSPGILGTSGTENGMFFPDDLIGKLGNDNINLVLGDVETPYGMLEDSVVIAETLAGIAGLTAAYSDWATGKPIPKEKVTRRKFLKGVAAIGAVWGAGPLVSTYPHVKISETEQMAVRRIADRINAMQTRLHPEQVTIFFRNLKFAHTLLTYAENYKKEHGRTPKVGFNVGAGHAGVEDFIALGPEKCREYILAFPKQFLEATVDINHPGYLYSCRSVSLPQGFKIEDLKNPDSGVKDKVLVDEKLRHMVSQKIGKEI